MTVLASYPRCVGEIVDWSEPKPEDLDDNGDVDITFWLKRSIIPLSHYPPFKRDGDVEENTPRRKRRPLIFRERDIARAIAGHLKAGLSVARVEIDASGRIVVVTGNAEPTGSAPNNEWDDVR